MRRATLPLLVLVVCIVSFNAHADCMSPPRPCVCDFAAETALDVQTEQLPDGGFSYTVTRQGGSSVDIVDGGRLDTELRKVDLGHHYVSVSDGGLVGSASLVEDDYFLCNGSFRANPDKVFAAMTSPDCIAAMADAGVVERPPQPCHDTGLLCDLGGSTAPVALGIAALVMTIVRSHRRIH